MTAHPTPEEQILEALGLSPVDGIATCPACDRPTLRTRELFCDQGCDPTAVADGLASMAAAARSPSRRALTIAIADRIRQQAPRAGSESRIDVANTEPPSPLGRSPVPAFPVSTLPPPLRELCEAMADALQVPVDVPALLSLAVVATAAQRRHVVVVRDGYSEPLSLYVAAVLDSGERKSACMEMIIEPLAEWERSEAERLAGAIAEELSQRQTAMKRKERLETQAAKTDDPATRLALTSEAAEIAAELAAKPEPVFPRLQGDDITPEALGRLMALHGERMAIFSAEGGIFDTMAGRYSNGTPNLDVFLKGHAGDRLRIDRRNAAPVVMESPALTMGLAIQPDVLRALADKPGFRGRGLLARFVYALPVSRVGYRSVATPSVPEVVRERYAARIRALLEAPVPADGQVVRLRLAPEALTARDGLAERLEVRMRPGADLNHAKDWVGKAPGLAVRLAGLMHLVAAQEGEITGQTMRAAITIVEDYALPHALAAFGTMGADPELEAARAIVEWVHAQDVKEVSERDIHQGLRGQARFSRIEAVRAGVRVAEKHGHLRLVPSNTTTSVGRPPSPRYAVVATEQPSAPRNTQNPQKETERPGCEDSEDFEGEVIPAVRGVG